VRRTTSAYAGAIPSDVLLACGVFGNVMSHDVERTIRLLPSLCARGAVVIWTRHRRPPDLTSDIRRWFADVRFDEVAFDAPAGTVMSVGSHRFSGDPDPFAEGVRMFTFVPRE
jgi:hypothetical protein